MGHFQLREDGSSTMAEQLELSGSKSFYVSPNSKNETQAPIRGSAIVSILGKNYSIQLTHRVKDYTDPEPSSTKWSYVENLYISGTTPVPSTDAKDQDTGYIRASRGKTVYNSIGYGSKVSTILISNAYTTAQAVLDRVGDFSDSSVGTSYNKGAIMTLFTFTMYYKYSTESEGTVIPPVDDGTPASNKARIPCRPDHSSAPPFITNLSILYQVNYVNNGSSGSRSFGTWDDFIAFWNSIKTNPDYTDAVFHYLLQGTVAFNELLASRGGSGPITITEIDNGDGIHGAKSLYLVISQQEGKNTYGASIIPAETYMQDNNGRWYFNDPSEYSIYYNKAGIYNQGTYNLKPKFRIDSAQNYHAYPINLMTGGTVITNPEGAGSVNYQYIGQPFILKLFKETANGIEGRSMRPYYKQTSSTTAGSTEFWRDSIQILGSQNFNPIQYDSWSGENHYAHVRNSGYRGFLSGPTSGNYGLCIFQLVPLCLYKQNQEQYTFTDGRLTNYNVRYLNYQSAILNRDRYSAAFLKWPNPDGNNNPSHIDTQGDTESIPSQMGKMWESNVQNNGDFKFINRVMFIPVLWTETPLEDSDGFRNALINNTLGFGHYLLSPDIPDSEVDADPTTIYRIRINGLDIQMR